MSVRERLDGPLVAGGGAVEPEAGALVVGALDAETRGPLLRLAGGATERSDLACLRDRIRDLDEELRAVVARAETHRHGDEARVREPAVEAPTEQLAVEAPPPHLIGHLD